MKGTAIGIHVHAQPQRLLETLAALRTHTAPGCALLLLPDGPNPQTRAVLAQLPDIPQSATEAPLGPAACFNRLALQDRGAEILVLLESGTIVSPAWLDRLCDALAADPRHGLASPSTNRAWNQLAAFPNAGSSPEDIARTAGEAEQRFGRSLRSLAPLWDVGDFCLAARRAAIEAAGPADEAYGLGPCWEMDYAVRVVRAGFFALWAQGAYVFRHPPTPRREREEARLFDASRRRYQDKFCGLKLSGARQGYAGHCRGEECQNFAPPDVAVETSRPAPRPAGLAPSSQSLVSCIMPTRGRPEWMLQAIRYFQRQDYVNRELVIIDATPRSLASLIPPDPRIRHVHVPDARTIGAMRNIACEQARGGIIIHWDDDDWYAPNRINAQVQPILDGTADITGLTDVCFLELDTWAFWRCTDELHRRLFVLNVNGGTLAFRRSLFGPARRYPDVSLAEDAHFLWHVVRAGARLAAVPGEGLFVYLRHPRNSWQFPIGQYIDPAGWQRTREPDWFAADRNFYQAHAGKPVAAPPSSTPVPTAPRPLPAPAIASGQPLVSCIMPTSGRRRFVPLAIRQFLRQDYARKELIVVDDGADAVADLIGPDPRIRYFYETPPRRLGNKRNSACEKAQGDILVHWDDDDWYAPWRLTYQVTELEADGAALCGLDHVLFLDESARRAWEYVYPPGGAPWVCGATFCFRRELWQRNRFADVNVGEDTLFVFAAGARNVRALPRREFFVGRIHAGNVSPKQTRDPRWLQAPYDRVRALIEKFGTAAASIGPQGNNTRFNTHAATY